MKQFRFYTALLAIIFSSAISFSQSPEFSVIQSGLPTGDSSYYDVCRVGNDEFWAIGKKGIITKFGTGGVAEMPAYPNKGIDLLNMTLLDDENFLLCGDKGFVYQYNKKLQQWNVAQVKGYENSCFYSICAVDEKTAFISGGSSKIASSQRVIPFGFILKTEDGGKTWKRVFKSVTNMIWSVKYDKQAHQIFALVYTTLNTKLLFSSDNGLTWDVKEKNIKGLYHDFKIIDGKLFLAGCKNGHFRKNGMVKSGENIFKYNKTGIFWDVDVNENYAIASSMGGNLLVKNNKDEWNLIQSPVKNNLYEIAFIDSKSAFVVGNSKTIIRVDFR